ncbi:hypothetical protein HPP92_005083 [Vanilla planifolia]|uniref:Isopenicillin N synthase-like Fe(2+) 2OG dioxygenase domain-containing protein n=1 Tax=Vanilla planifolia TaxID=51239 RepID=A0A835RP01_VANPL|nr:hypothetical protein HPP92_005083 [Vanilla planifolia]
MPPLKSLPDLHPPSAAAAAPLRSQYLRDIPILDLASPDKSQVAAQIGLACQIYGFFQRRSLFGGWSVGKISSSSSGGEDELLLRRSFKKVWAVDELQCEEGGGAQLRGLSPPPLLSAPGVSSALAVSASGFQSRARGELHRKHVGPAGAAHGNQLLPQVSRTELTYGLPAHTDPNALTILLQEPHVVGLHVLRDGEWTAVDPRQAPSSSTSAISFRRSAMGGTKSVASGGGEFREGEDVGGVLLLPV